MFNIEFFLKGLLIGIFVSAPMGPIGVLCIQKTVNKGRFLGFLSGLGAATGDTFYAIVAAFGATFITNFLNKNQTIFQLFGILILIFLGFRMIFRNPVKQYRYYRSSSKKHNALKDYISVFFLTISNPFIILFLGTLFTMMGLLSNDETTRNNLFMVAGVFSGATLWWFLLTYIVNIFRKKFHLRNIFILNRVSGIIIIILSIAAAIKFWIID